MFSVIIPLYNKAAYIAVAVRSVLQQSFQAFELIVVDDGSTDDSLAQLALVLKDLPLPKDKVRVVKQANQGVSVARNQGVKQARYPYIAFLDADDWWDPSYLGEMHQLISRYPDAGLYSSSYFKVVHGQHIAAHIGVSKGFTDGEINYFETYARTMYQPVWTGAAIIRKELLDVFGGFNARLKMGEDFDLWYRVALCYPVAFLNKPLAYYNQDVDAANRAIGPKLYTAEQHFLFSNYEAAMSHPGFRRLYEVLAVYGLLPYYLSGKNKAETDAILKQINWQAHPLKYRLYYRVLPKPVLRLWLSAIRQASVLKRRMLSGKRK